MIRPMRAWERGKNKIAYVYRDKETNRKRIGEFAFKWFFYVLRKDYEEHRGFFEKQIDDKLINGFDIEDQYVKVFVDREHNEEFLDKNCEMIWEFKNQNFNKLKEKLEMRKIQTFEADILPHKRWLLSEDVQIEDEYLVGFLDIETDDRDMAGQPIPGEKRILSIAFKDYQTEKEIWICCEEDTDEAEKEMLLKAAKIMVYYDVLAAWNGKPFDFPYIMERFMRYGIVVDWRKLFLQDHLFIFKKHGPQLTSYSLDSVGNFVCGERKVEHEEKIYEMWKNNRQLLKEYNLQDVRIMYFVEKKTNFLAAARQVNVIGKCFVDDIYITRKIDNLILMQAQEDGNYHFKTKVKQEEAVVEEDDTFEGAYVFPPMPGLHKNVRVLDFASLYPNTIKTFNISPDTLIEPCDIGNISKENIITTPCGHKFRSDFIGIIPKVITRMAEMRKKYKDLMSTVEPGSIEHKTYDRLQYVFKSFGLSFYGALGNVYTRFYDVRIAESVTLSGQHFIKAISEYVKQNNFEILYGDTDSVFIGGINNEKIIPILIRNISKVCKAIATKTFNCKSCTLEMDYDKGFKAIIIVRKKRYAGLLSYLDGHYLETPKMYIAGLEYKRTDNCEIVRKKQEELIRLILRDDTPDVLEVRKFVLDLKAELFSRKIPINDLVFAQKITKPLEEYEGRQMHKITAEEMMRDGKEVWVGDKIRYFIERLDNENKPVPRPPYAYNGKYDEIYYWNNKIFPPLERILEIVYHQTDWSTYHVSPKGGKKTKLGRTNLW
jgi:DNA polymerase I